jgi:hypothetical protein
MNNEKLIEIYKTHFMGDIPISHAIKAVTSLEQFLIQRKMTFETATVEVIEDYISYLIKVHHNDAHTLLAIAYYYNAIDRTDIYNYFNSLFEGHTIIGNIKQRVVTHAGIGTMEKVFFGLKYPPLGTPPKAFSDFAKGLVKRIEDQLPKEVFSKVFASNKSIDHEDYIFEKQVYESIGLPKFEPSSFHQIPIRSEFENRIKWRQ